jgi:pimeloyl-ACP methyl ester carboxylesterase
MRHEHLVQVRSGSRDVVVGISGFGSAEVNPQRWTPAFDLTGRTTFALHYDSQDFPFPSPFGTLFNLTEFYARWKKARVAARSASEFLAGWLERWAADDRKVLVIGFSLGGYIAARATRLYRHPNVEMVLMCAAVGDRTDYWRGIEDMGRVVNMYSSSDMALRRVYPYAVSLDETPAAGLGPLSVSAPNVSNVNVTDLVGADHLWASDNVQVLMEIALGHLWGIAAPNEARVPVCELREGYSSLSDETYLRLLRWAVLDDGLWDLLRRAMSHDAGAVEACEGLDRWSLEEDRLGDLLVAGAARVAIEGDESIASGRRRLQLSGLTRLLLESSATSLASRLPPIRAAQPRR